MIPKIIHYVWLSDEKMPYCNRKCLESWQKNMQGYEIKHWKMSDFDFEKMPFAADAISVGKWAFATDYLRMYILYREGGIYLDTDVFIKHPPDEKMLSESFFSCIEYHHDSTVPVIQAAFMGAEAGCALVRKCLEYYDGRHFIRGDGSLDTDRLAPDVYALCAKEFGFLDIPEEQILDGGIHIYPKSLVAGSSYETEKDNIAVHMCAGSWRNLSSLQKIKIKLHEQKILSKLIKDSKNEDDCFSQYDSRI